MVWLICLILSAAMLLLAVVAAVLFARARYKSGRLLDSTKILFIGVVLSAVVLFLPIYLHAFENSENGPLETLFISVHNMIQLFIVDGDFFFITEQLDGLSPALYSAYSVMFCILFIMAPLLTFGFVLSFFKNVSAYQRYISNFRTDVFVFSELNERSVTLAKSLYQNRGKRRFFIFTDVFESEEERCYELLEQAKELGAICFKKDIVTVNFALHSKKSAVSFFAIGDEETENISQALKLIELYRGRENTNLYVFSTCVETELLLSNAFNTAAAAGEPAKIKVRRINEVQSLISRTLYEDGYSIFKNALPNEETGLKEISALIVGMGGHGFEMTKALAWFCQMDGYRAEINAFDAAENAASVFASACPELMDAAYNGQFDIEGEAKYKITVHGGLDAATKEFDEAVLALPQVTYVLVAPGTDEQNIAVAVKLRTLFARAGYTPQIQAIVRHTEKKEALAGITNFKGQPYDIEFIGDLKTSYSEAVVLDSEVEQAALARHLKWGKEDAFWQYGYNYKSSVASAIHRRMKIACGIAGADQPPEEREEDAKQRLRILEHCRWNAYMRSEGYCYAPERNDLAKTHHCLVPFDALPLAEQIKDDD